MCSPYLYISGYGAYSEDLVTLLDKILSQLDENVSLVGSSKGALIALFFSLGLQDQGTKREFFETCRFLQNSTLSLEQKRSILCTWIKAISGGGACTLRQWRARGVRNFYIFLYDYSAHMPILVDCQNNYKVVDVIIHACLRESPSFNIPKSLLHSWIDVETIIPPSVLCNALKPVPLLHFASSSKFELKRPWNSSFDSQILIDIYDAMLSKLPTTLTMIFHTSELPESGLAVFDPRRWCRGLASGQTSTINITPDKTPLTRFTIAFLTWNLITIYLHGRDER